MKPELVFRDLAGAIDAQSGRRAIARNRIIRNPHQHSSGADSRFAIGGSVRKILRRGPHPSGNQAGRTALHHDEAGHRRSYLELHHSPCWRFISE
jgi:hypothetical protein